MAIMISQTPVRLREILLRDKPDAMLEASKQGTVPVLVDGDFVVEQSLDVMHWALAKNDPETWLTSANDPLIAHSDGPFKHHLDRYKYASRYQNENAEDNRKAGYDFLVQLDKELAKAPFLAGQERGFVDIAIFPFIRQFRIAGTDWFDKAPIQHVHHWLSGLTTSSLYQSVMAKNPIWKDTGEEIIFPAHLATLS